MPFSSGMLYHLIPPPSAAVLLRFLSPLLGNGLAHPRGPSMPSFPHQDTDGETSVYSRAPSSNPSSLDAFRSALPDLFSRQGCGATARQLPLSVLKEKFKIGFEKFVGPP